MDLRTRLATIALGICVMTVTGAVEAAVLEDLELLLAETAEDSTTLKEIQIDCPPGKVAVSGGALIDAPAGTARLLQSTPLFDPPTAWYGLAAATTRQPWTLELQAWCADPPPGFELVTQVTATDPAEEKDAVVWCPEGKRTLGVGAQVFLAFEGKGLNHLGPIGNATGAQTGAYDVGGGTWGLAARALCASDDIDLLEIGVGAGDVSGRAVLRMYCPDGWVALSGGGWGHYRTYLRESGLPAPALFPGTWGVEHDLLAESGVILNGRAVCVEVPVFADGFEDGTASDWSAAAGG